jgi:hypothetical protein
MIAAGVALVAAIAAIVASLGGAFKKKSTPGTGSSSSSAAGSTITKDVPAQALGIARDRQTNLDGWAAPKMEAYIAKKQKLEAEQNK